MTTHTPPPKDWREGRRLRAWDLHAAGWKQKDIAAALGVSEGAVSQWLRRGREGGVHALRHRPSPGAPPRLNAEQRAQIPALLAQGAEAYGFAGDVWTTRRVAAVLERTFGVRYHPAHVSRLLRRLDWSPQKPVVRATQRDEAAIRAWLDQRWPLLQRKATAQGRTIVWVDESGFYLLPGVVRTYAPRGQTPCLRVRLTRDHLAVISGLTLQGRLLVQVREQAFDGAAVVGFLRHLLRHIDGKLLVLWDGAPIHRNRAVKAFLAAGAAARLQLEQLPGYAPEVNPAEGLWHYLKHVELRNVCCFHLRHLRGTLQRAIARLRHKHSVLRGCLAHSGLQFKSLGSGQ